MTAEVLREAALRPDAPPRLRRAADAVQEGKFSWADVATGRCDHPLALSLFSQRAYETLWPLLTTVAGELDSPPAERPARRETQKPVDDDSYFDDFSVLPGRVRPRSW